MRSTDFAEKIGTTKADIENWRSRDSVQLRTRYAETKAGSAREYSLENVIELAVISAMVKIGCKPSTAAAYANMAIRNYRTDQNHEWLVFSDGDFSKGKALSEVTPSMLSEAAASGATKTVAIVHLSEIILGVEDLFKGNQY